MPAKAAARIEVLFGMKTSEALVLDDGHDFSCRFDVAIAKLLSGQLFCHPQVNG